LPALELAGTGVDVHAGDGAVTLPALELAGTGHVERIGAGALTLPALEVAGTGVDTHTGAGAVELPALVVAGTGSSGPDAIGTGAITLPALTLAGTGYTERIGTGALTLPALEVSGTGSLVTDIRVTAAAAQLVTGPGSGVRVTAAGVQMVTGPPSVIRVTAAALQLVELGGTGVVWSVGGITDTTANVVVSPDATILELQYQLSASPAFGTLLLDNTTTNFGQPLTALVPLTTYYVRIKIRTAVGWWGWEPTQQFTTLATAPVVGLPRRWLAPMYGEPIRGTYTLQWSYPSGASSADIWISDNFGASWVQVAAGVTGTTSPLDTTAYSDGINYILRIDFDNGDSETHYGFKIANTSWDDHVFIPYTGALGPGSAAHRILWDTSVPWYPLSWEGVSAVLSSGTAAEPSLAIPPQIQWAIEADVTSYVRIGTTVVSSYPWWSVAQLNAYLVAGGMSSGVAALASGTLVGGDQRGIYAYVQMGDLWPAPPCPEHGKNQQLARFKVIVQNTPTGSLTGDVTFSVDIDALDLWAVGPGSCAFDQGLIPVRLRVTRESATKVRIQAGMAGFDGSTYWLVDEVDVSYDAAVLIDDCDGNCGWAGHKVFGTVWSEGFRSGETLGQTIISGDPLLDCGCVPAVPCADPLGFREFVGRKHNAYGGSSGASGATGGGSGASSGGYTSGGDAILELDRMAVDDQGYDYTSKLTPTEIFPAGAAGEALFKAVYISLEAICPTTFDLTPILNGRRLDTITVSVPGRALTDEPDVWRVEVPLVEKYLDGGTERFRYGLRGTFFTFELSVIPSEADVTFAFLEADVAVQVLRESQPGIVFYEEALVAPTCGLTEYEFFGQREGDGIAQPGGEQDFGTDFENVLYMHATMPGGAPGEAMFPFLYLLVTRNNSQPVTVTVTPYLDTYALPQETVTLAAVSDPVSDVHEVAVDREAYTAYIERFKYSPRGIRMAFKFELSGVRGGEVIFEHAEIQAQVLRESEEAVSV
jgi:hypothetical protein